MDTRLVVLALGQFVGTMESSAVPALLPSIGAETGASLADTGYVVFGYTVAYAIAAPVLGALLGAADRRRVLAAAELTLGLCALLIALAPTLQLIIVARALLAGAAVLFTSMAQATAVAVAAPERRGRALSILLTGGTLGVAVGAPLNALIGLQFGWRVTFGVVAVVAIIAAATIWLRLPAGIVGERRGLRERFAVLVQPGVPAILATSLFYLGGAFVITIYLAAITTQAMHLAASTLPLLLLANGLGSVLGGMTGGQLIDRFGARRSVLALMLATVVVMALIPAVPLLPEPLILPVWMLVVAFLGVTGWAVFAGLIAMLAGLAPQVLPLAASLNLSAMNVGIAIGAVAGSTALARAGAGSLGLVAAAFCLCGAAIVLFNRRAAAA
ncbi:MAG: MFS transporter [Devosia sp.]